MRRILFLEHKSINLLYLKSFCKIVDISQLGIL